MKRNIGSLTADVFPPENGKFKSPLILVHGLWSGGWIWREWAVHGSNLGWECWALNFKDRTETRALEIPSRLTFEACVDDLQDAVRAAPHPPVVLAHDFGGLAAMKLAEACELAALVLVAPLPPAQVKAAPPRPFRLLRLKYAPLTFFGRSFRLRDTDFSSGWLSALPEARRPAILAGMVPEANGLIKEFFYRSVEIDPARIHCPVLVVAGKHDPLVSLAAFHELAAMLGARFLAYPGHGHWIMGEEDGPKIVRAIHRWLVQELGEAMLLALVTQ